MVNVEHETSPRANYDDDFTPNHKTGSVRTAASHFFCAMVGSGVLAFPRAVAWLGWIAGPILIIVFYCVALVTAGLLASCYRVNGKEHGRYHHAVNSILGKRHALACSIFQLLTLFLVDIAWSITGATSAKAIATDLCSDPNNCFNSIWVMGLLFGAVELVLSQVRNLEEAWWVSATGVAMSFIYSIIAFVCAAVQAASTGGQGTVGGIAAGSTDKAMGVLNALGIIAFGFSGGQVLLEIQDTLRQPPSPVAQMKKANVWAISGAALFYISVALTGYAAYGNGVQGFILDSVTHPKWAVVLANIAILIHVLTAFQVFAQAVFDTLESHAKWFLLRRAERKLLEAEAATAQGSPTKAPAATTGSFIAPSPFGDQPRGPAPRISAMMGYQKSSLPPLEERLSSRMSSGMSGRISTPKAAAKGAQGSTSESLPGSEERDTVQDLPDIVHATLPVLPTRSGHQSFSMYGLDTGLANEEVPLNTERVLAPLWVRLLVRSLYVALVTLITVIMPFFSAISGLVGSIIFWPLIVHFPVVCYRKVYGRANRGLDVVLSIIYWGFLVVCIAAVVASFYTLVQEWQTFKFFGS